MRFLYKSSLHNALPFQEVLNMLKESKADIFVDPVLHTACALDIKHHCAAITPGRGRRKSLHRLSPACAVWVVANSLPHLRQPPLEAWFLPPKLGRMS